VLVKGSKVIANTPKTIKNLLTNKTPFLIFTNSGGTSEQSFATQLGKTLNVEGLSGDHVSLCHSALKDRAMVRKYGSKYVVVDGPASPQSMVELA